MLNKISEHVYVLPFDADTDRPNLLYIKGEEKNLLFDAGCGPKTIALLMKELEENHLSLPDVIVISHYHWDHSFAAGYLEGEYYASPYTIEKMKVMKEMEIRSTDDLIREDLMPEFCREHLRMEYEHAEEIRIKVPDHVIEGNLVMDLGGVRAEIFEIISPHCEGQLACYVQEDDVMMLGDSFSAEIVGTEFIDDPVKRKVFNQTMESYDPAWIVTGHSEPCDRETFRIWSSEEYPVE